MLKQFTGIVSLVAFLAFSVSCGNGNNNSGGGGGGGFFDPLIFVNNIGENSISVINSATNEVDDTLTDLGGVPSAAAFSPDGSRAYVSFFDELGDPPFGVAIVDTSDGSIIDTIEFPDFEAEFFGAIDLDVSPDGQTLAVALFSMLGSVIVTVDTATLEIDEEVFPFEDSIIFDITISPDSERVYISLITELGIPPAGEFIELELSNGDVDGVEMEGEAPFSAILSSNGGTAFVLVIDENEISRLVEIDLETLEMVDELEFGEMFGFTITQVPNANVAYVSGVTFENMEMAPVLIKVDLNNMTELDRTELEHGFDDIAELVSHATTADGARGYVYVMNLAGDDSVVVPVDLNTMTDEDPIDVGVPGEGDFFALHPIVSQDSP